MDETLGDYNASRYVVIRALLHPNDLIQETDLDGSVPSVEYLDKIQSTERKFDNA